MILYTKYQKFSSADFGRNLLLILIFVIGTMTLKTSTVWQWLRRKKSCGVIAQSKG